jgi:hypothetical protein
MASLIRLRSLFLPVSISVILLIALGLYSFIWIPSQQRYLDDRNFRVLKTLSGQIKANIDNFDAMMDNAAESGITDQTLAGYLKNAGLELSALEEQDKAVIGEDYGDPPKIAVRADEGSHFLYMAFQNGDARYGVRTDLDRLIRKLLPPDERDPFDAIVLAQSDGRVIFEKSAPGIDVANIDELVDAPRDSKTETPARTLTKKWSSRSTLEEVQLAGARYRSYSEPLQLSVSLIDAAKKTANATGTPASPAEWVLCGLIRADKYRLESQSVSYTYILYFTVAILLAVAVFPFLKLHVSSPSERLKRSDVIGAALFACFAASTIAFILLDIYHWRRHFADPADEEMKTLAKDIDENFAMEKKQAFLQLADFHKEPALRYALRGAGAEVCSKARPKFSENGKTCHPDVACRQEILSGKAYPKQLSSYPYLELVTWSDACGTQRVKWAIKKNVTPFLNLDDPSVPYYPDIKRAFNDPGAGTPAPTEGVGTRYSANTGENVAAFWKLLDVEGNPVSGKIDERKRNGVFCASIVTRPISVVGPIIPAGYQFAVIKPDGLVVFHSDPSRNLRENFLDETDHDPSIHSRVLMRAEGFVDAKYTGRSHRLYVYPMTSNQEALWSVIVFRDRRTGETMNLEMLSLASIMFLFYGAALAAVLVSAYLVYRGPATRSWLWPDSRKVSTYRRLIVVNSIAALLVLALSQLPGLRAPLLGGLAVPAAIALVNLLALMDEKDKSVDGRWKSAYVGACATLLAVVAVLPCLALFKVACEFEHTIFVESSQLRLAADIDERARRVRSRYQSVDLGSHVAQIMAEPNRDKQLFSYHNGFLKTTIASVSDAGQAKCDAGSTAGGDRAVESILGRLSPLYNDVAAEGRYLSEKSCSDVWGWKLSDANELKLTKQEPGDMARVIVTSWDSLHVPWGNGVWWIGTITFFLIFLSLTWRSLGRIFLFDLGEAPQAREPAAECDPAGLLAKLSMNLVVLGPRSSGVIQDLRQRTDVQAYDLYERINTPMRLAKTADGGSVNASTEPLDSVMRDPRPIVFYDFDRGLEDPEANQQKLAALQRLQSKDGLRIVIASNVDPLRKALPANREEWQTLLRPFVTIDLHASPNEQPSETALQSLSKDAYYGWLLSSSSKAKKLELVQLAQEGLVNPNSRCVVSELIRDGLVVRRDGMIAVRDIGFCKFLKSAIPQETIARWERLGASGHSTVARTSLLVAGACLTGFLIYTQGAIFQTWVTYASGLAASLPVFLRLFEMFRSGKTETRSS